jgi:hypothetical protein
MHTREQLKALIDTIPDDRVESVYRIIDLNLRNPSRARMEVEAMRAFRAKNRARFIERMGGTSRLIGSDGSGGITDGLGSGHFTNHFRDGRSLVTQTLHFLEGREIEEVVTLTLAENGAAIDCSIEVSSGARKVLHRESFPGNVS